MTSRRMFPAILTLIFALNVLAPSLNERASAGAVPPAPAHAVSFAVPLAVQGCDSCTPKILEPRVNYLRFNGLSHHEVEVSFSYQLPSCLPNLNGVEFKALKIELVFPNGVRRERIGAGIDLQKCSGGGSGQGLGVCLGTLVRVLGSASDRNPLSYTVSISAQAPIKGFGSKSTTF